MFLLGSVKATIIIKIIIINCEEISQLFLCPNLLEKGKLKLSTIGDHKYLKAYAKPAQLNRVTVLRSIPALMSHTDKVENTSKMGNPEENPRQKIFKHFPLKNIDKLFLN